MSHTVRFSDGTELQAEPGEAVLDAALRRGVTLPYGCRNGVCGSCKARLLDGEIAYPEGQPKALDAQERAAGYALLCQASARSDLRIDLRPGAYGGLEPRTLTATVAAVEEPGPRVRRLLLEPDEAQRLPFHAGQYVEIVLDDGERRAFSLANPPHDDRYLELHVRYIPGGRFTEHVFGGLRVGERLRLEGPLGQFYLREDARRPVLLVGGGTGFAPLKAILEHALAAGDERAFELYWGAREGAELYMGGWAEAQARAHPGLRYTPVLSGPRPEEPGRRGWVHEAVVADHPDLSGYDVYMSGPPPMIEAAKAAFLEHGLDPERLFYDAFRFSHE